MLGFLLFAIFVDAKYALTLALLHVAKVERRNRTFMDGN